MTFCSIGIIPRMYLPQIILMIILAITIYMVYDKAIIKYSDKCLINKSVYPIRLFTTTTGKKKAIYQDITIFVELKNRKHYEQYRNITEKMVGNRAEGL